jgi:hypothetical protein
MQTGDPDALERLLLAASDALASYAEEFLQGSQGAFEHARSLRSQRAAEFTEGVNDAPILRTANEAWRHTVESRDVVCDDLDGVRVVRT